MRSTTNHSLFLKVKPSPPSIQNKLLLLFRSAPEDMVGGQSRGRTRRRHFKKNRENVWKYSNDGDKGKPDVAGGDDSTAADTRSNPNANSNTSWQPFATQNLAFEEYYKMQCIVPVEEWEEFIAILRNPLPAAFRINSSAQFFKDIRTQLEEDFTKSLYSDIQTTNEYEVEAIRPLHWYPGNLAWHLNFSRMQLRKNQALERFHEFLKRENEIGNITRQEAVSMVPPLFLDVLPEHHVLDMCAAPGSKTFQLLELMHNSTEIGSLPGGMVIANDVDVQRCNLLIHQTKRLCCSNLIVTNHEAQHFPSCHLKSSFLEAYTDTSVNGVPANGSTLCEGQENLKCRELLFHRVLCDVPCSGDGTLRKAPDIWRKWHSGNGNGLHPLQVQIAIRGLTLLKVGGRMVYSTCSMNPVENEAVVSEVLSKCGESIELLDVSIEIPGLVRRPGLRKWKVRDKGLWLSSYKDVPAHRKSTILPSMFPAGRTFHDVNSNKIPEKQLKINPILGDMKSVDEAGKESNLCSSVIDINIDCNEEISSLPLDRCMRILPHDQNSGAFFIAVFQKLSSFPVVSQKSRSHNRHAINSKNGIHGDKPEISESKHAEKMVSENIPVQTELAGSNANALDKQLDVNADDNADIIDCNIKARNEVENRKINDVVNDEERDKVAERRLQRQGKWKGIDPVVFFDDSMSIDSIKTFYGISESFQLNGHLVSRNEDSNHVKRIYYVSKSVQEVLKLNFKVGQRLKIASLGLKLFERQASKDGSTCAFRISSEGLPLILPYIGKQILHAPLGDFERLLQLRSITFAEFIDADFSEKLSMLLSGCCVVVLNTAPQPSDNILVDEQTIAIVCWKGKNSLSILLSEMDGNELRERLKVRFGIGKSTVPDES